MRFQLLNRSFHIRTLQRLGVVAAIVTGTLLHAAPATMDEIEVLPGMDRSSAVAVSADGSITVGSCRMSNATAPVAFRWTKSGGTVALKRVPEGSQSIASAISGDGHVIFGSMGSAPCLWSGAADPEFLTVPADWASISFSDANQDGTVAVGQAKIKNIMRAFRWRRASGFADLGTFQPASSWRTSWAVAVSADGNVVVGNAEGDWEDGAFRWTAAGGMVNIGKLPGSIFTQVFDASNSGNEMLVRSTYFEQPSRIVRWLANGSTLQVGNFPGGYFYEPTNISGDGNVIFGVSSTPTAIRLTRWTSFAGVQDLLKYLPTVGINLLPWPPANTTGTNLTFADSSVDGRTMVGNGYRNGIPRGFVIQLPTLFRVCAPDLNEDGVVDDADFVEFVSQYDMLLCKTAAMPTCTGDFNADGYVDDADFVLFVHAYEALLCP